MTLSNDKVTFPVNKAEVSPEAKAMIDEAVAPLVKENRGVYFEIEGHTDNTGDKNYNFKLGEERAMAVRDYIAMTHGIALSRLSVISYGEEKPVAENNNRDGPRSEPPRGDPHPRVAARLRKARGAAPRADGAPGPRAVPVCGKPSSPRPESPLAERPFVALTSETPGMPGPLPAVSSAEVMGPGPRPTRVPLPEPDEAFVVARARKGDASAFEELVRRHQRRVYAVALRIVRAHDVADDVAQEAFVRAWRALDRFEAGRPFAPWVCRIAANLAINHVRSPRAREDGLPEGHHETPAHDPSPLGEPCSTRRPRASSTPPSRRSRSSSAPSSSCARWRTCPTRRSRRRSR